MQYFQIFLLVPATLGIPLSALSPPTSHTPPTPYSSRLPPPVPLYKRLRGREFSDQAPTAFGRFLGSRPACELCGASRFLKHGVTSVLSLPPGWDTSPSQNLLVPNKVTCREHKAHHSFGILTQEGCIAVNNCFSRKVWMFSIQQTKQAHTSFKTD